MNEKIPPIDKNENKDKKGGSPEKTKNIDSDIEAKTNEVIAVCGNIEKNMAGLSEEDLKAPENKEAAAKIATNLQKAKKIFGSFLKNLNQNSTAALTAELGAAYTAGVAIFQHDVSVAGITLVTVGAGITIIKAMAKTMKEGSAKSKKKSKELS
jgi:hypothetical protein